LILQVKNVDALKRWFARLYGSRTWLVLCKDPEEFRKSPEIPMIPADESLLKLESN
jgi:hypothetical protein